MRHLVILFLILCATPAAANPDVMRVLHMLDYIGVDYPEFVRDGKVLDALEYEEQQNFAAAIIERLQTLPPQPAQADLLADAKALRAAIDRKASGSEIQRITGELAAAVGTAYPVPQAPRRPPDVAQAKALFDAQCTACHGTQGRGDGVLAAGQEPAPTNFHELARQQQRSVFGLYNVISNGVVDTAMPSFAALPETQRWALAFYVGQLVYSDAQRRRGAELIASGQYFGIPGLAGLSQAVPQQLAAEYGEDGVALMAYLRANPAAIIAPGGAAPLAKTQDLLEHSLRAYAAGQHRPAADAALAAYLDGYELQEAAVSTVDPRLNARIEGAMLNLRRAIDARAPAAEVAALGQAAHELLEKANERLEGASMNPVSSFVGSFIILAREGLEAILVLAALFAFLGKVERHDAKRYVHFGWILALACGVLTWVAATYFVSISGASREITEGISALLAAVVLLSVGLWMHNKSLSGQWQRYINQHMHKALNRGGLWGIAGLAFIATYREVFETVLFYQALWTQGDHPAILAGFAVAAVVLVVLTAIIVGASRRLPLQQFFSVSALLIVALAFVFTGQGVQALQEAGVLASDAVPFVSLPLLGIYPNLQGLLSQAAVVVLVYLAFGWNRRSSAA